MSSMESIRLRVLLLTAVAPAAWGTTYVVTEQLLPPDRPLFAATVRALPVGLVLLALLRRRPHGIWWWRTLVLGACNIGLFFPLIFLAAYQLPGGLAATVQAASPLAVMAHGAARAGRAPRHASGSAPRWSAWSASALLVLRSPGEVSMLGLAAALGSVLVSAFGFVLIKRWPAPVDMLTLVSWQLVAGGLLLLPIGLLVEGAPPAVDAPALAGFAWLAVVGTGLAYYCWFRGLAAMPAGAVSLVGLLNPVVGTALGVVVAGELFGVGPGARHAARPRRRGRRPARDRGGDQEPAAPPGGADGLGPRLPAEPRIAEHPRRAARGRRAGR